MILKIIQAGDDVLSQKAKKVSLAQLKNPETQQLIDLMIATLRDRPGVGLAAPQVGESLQIIVIEDKKAYQDKVSKDLLKAQVRTPIPLKVIINPILQIMNPEETSLFFEGCLSVDGYLAVTPRANTVHVSGLDRKGNAVSFTATGWQARILQHEVSHLDGCLYLEKILPKTFITEKHYTEKWIKAHPMQLAQFIKESQK